MSGNTEGMNTQPDDQNPEDSNVSQDAIGINDSQNDKDNLAEPSEKIQEGSSVKRRKPPIPVWIFLFLILIIAIDVISMIRFPDLINEYKLYATSESKIHNGETYDTLYDLYALSEKHPNSVPILLKNIELAMKSGYYDMAGYLYDNYLSGKSLSDSEYSKADSYYSKLSNYYNTYDAINKIFNPDGNDQTEDDLNNDEVMANLKALLNQKDQDVAMIYYYLGVMAPDLTSAMDYMQKCYDTDAECFDVRVQLGIRYRRAGDFDKANYYNEEALTKEKLDAGALRSKAIIDMLQGNMDSGLNNAEAAYKSNPEVSYVRETYLIALSLNDKKEQAQSIQQEMEQAGEPLEPDTEKLLQGEMTLQEYYVEG